MNIEIANKLLQLRKEKGLSQEQLANELGISRQAVSKWERAEASPDTDNLIALAKLYDISLDELLLHEPTNKTEQTVEKEEYVHVGFDGIHVKEKQGDEVHVGYDGIHVSEYNGHKVDIDKNGIFIDEEHYGKDDFKHWCSERKNCFPFGLILFFMILIYACVTGQWHPLWIFLIGIPTIESLISAIRQRKLSKFAYPLLSVMIYLWLGFYYNCWHPGWVIFLTIPVYYLIADYIDYKRTS